ncbi:MAG: NAD-dependent protein deacetylase [Smithella sp. PtaU1.Bin162]|nr:MAG: NAD-dependent protein deacetylase [Smithella sp. PtaU1.Bin162]
MEDKINRVAEMIAQSKKIVVFTGAGVSTESGIPDFRGPGGMWSKYDPDDFTIDKFLGSEETRKKLWHIFREGGLIGEAPPNAAHYAIAELEKTGKLSSIITQNVDNLHQKAGNNPELVYELHGNMQMIICLNCRSRYPLSLIREANLNDSAPVCKKCRGILKPDVIFFGEALPQDTLMKATKSAQECDLLIVVGSSLVVYPAAYMPLYAKRAGARIVIVNMGPTGLDEIADVLVSVPAGHAMTGIMKRLKEIKP